jgi:energy-coupling factor transporter ATP-binding protein EcfA2
MTNTLADYENERSAFAALAQRDCDCRILLLRGESGSGKTSLLTHCQAGIPATARHVPIQLRGSTVDVAEIFYRAGRAVSWERLKQFTGQVAQLQQAASVKIDRNWLLGINNHISVALQADNPLDRAYRRAALTEAWFADVAALPEPLLMVFDTYEQGTAETREWLDGPFLARVATVDQMRVVIAGQSVPDRHNIEWGNCCREHRLYGVPEARHWLPVIEALGHYIPNESPLNWLAGVCHALQGKPADIIKVIERLPLRKDLP